MIDPETLNRIIIGTAEDVEAEYGYTNYWGLPVTVVHLWNGEVQGVDGAETIKAARALYADVPASQVEYL